MRLLVVPHYDAKGQLVDLVLYLNESVSVLSFQHLPYMVLAMITLIVFVFAPAALLMLYQWKPLEEFFQCHEVLRRNVVPFIESFQAGFKDGKNGRPDLRLFAGVYLIIRSIHVGTLVLLMSHSHTHLLFQLLAIIPTVALSGTCFVLRPYKDGFYNYLGGLFVLYGTLLLSLNMNPLILLLLILDLSDYHVPPVTLKLFLAIPIFI